jgi:hypothetical protein
MAGRVLSPTLADVMAFTQNLDSADHTSHTAYLSRLDNGKCPSTHPVAHIHLFYEVSILERAVMYSELTQSQVTWDVHSFAGRWTASDGWPFVYSTG